MPRFMRAAAHRPGLVSRVQTDSASSKAPVAGTTLPIGDAEVHASGSPLFSVTFAGPGREAVLQGADSPLQVVRAVAGKPVPVGNAEVHESGGPLFRIIFTRQHRERVLEG